MACCQYTSSAIGSEIYAVILGEKRQDKRELLEFVDKIVDHITVIEGFMQLNTERNTIENEIKELKSTILTFIEQLNKE
ncbi:hypothetical protein [Desulfosporosinus sp. BICA1-9]|uniref:hypothetical protein n=1 Tax=Desulfosporosinus sp. BICA1-9 TaxID=1531958 RepID=UPI00054B5845|nr:hypothetical protein [Desulfosporosinus sp. BICA1-9]KJS49912.1 MAG: hypothetical protein VR66_05895 [Peptococcaceae bacterium BRH_c23]KJS85413.1 MAG: hypothetical protein JL57_18735 [Desulfosporosinus sp. BICA1-9]